MLERRLKLLEVMDREGFYGFHMAEHHSTPLGWVPSPSVFVSAAIQRTKRLRIGPLVYVLPMYHPLRVYEEVCMLDHMSNGTSDVRRRPRRSRWSSISATASIRRTRPPCITRPTP